MNTGLARRNVALQQLCKVPSSATDSLATITVPSGAFAHAQRANAKGVAEGQQAVAGNQGDHGVRALECAGARRARRLEDVFAVAAARRCWRGPSRAPAR